MTGPRLRYDRGLLVWTLIQHQRRDSQSCLCGWGDLGKSHAAHVADEYEATARTFLGAAEVDPWFQILNAFTCPVCGSVFPQHRCHATAVRR